MPAGYPRTSNGPQATGEHAMPIAYVQARTFFDAMNARDFTDLELHLAPDVAFEFPGAGTIDGSRRMLLFLKLLFRRYSRLVFTVREVLADDERACVVWTNEGQTVDGGTYRNSGITFMRFSGGRIAYLSDYFKDTSFIKAG
jgi:ketosteroid isomerase-like protein